MAPTVQSTLKTRVICHKLCDPGLWSFFGVGVKVDYENKIMVVGATGFGDLFRSKKIIGHNEASRSSSPSTGFLVVT